MSFYSPYQSKPDYGQGLGDIATQIMQFLLMKKYMGGGPTKTQQATTALPKPTATNMMGAQQMSAMAPQMTPQSGGYGGGQIDPQQLAAILAKVFGGGSFF